MKKYLRITLLIFTLLLTSCAAEGYNLSPLSNSLSSDNGGVFVEAKSFSIDKNINASELSQLISTFPNFKNDGVDKEISKLKIHLTDYLQALKANNLAGKDRSLDHIEDCYKKLQKIRKFLDADHNEILNRYLVRVKTNIAEIESLSKVEEK